MKSIAIRFMASSLVACSLCLHGEAADAGRHCMDAAAVNAAEAKMAAQNHAQAQHNLGIYYAKFSDKEACRLAVKWLKETTKQDDADAQYNLAQLYLDPHHLASREYDAGRRAIALLRRAAAHGHADAKAKLKELGVDIQTQQLSNGRKQ